MIKIIIPCVSNFNKTTLPETFIAKLLQHLNCWICLLFLGVSTSSNAQNIAIPIGNTVDDEGGTTITKGPAGDYYIAGYSNDDAMVCRTTPEGVILWSKSIDLGPDPDYILHLDLTSDNFLIGCGNPRTLASDNPNGFIFKMDLSGTLIWSRTYVCDDNYMWANGLVEASNGNYRVIGSYTNIRLNNYVVEFDNATGTQVWDTIYARVNLSNSWDESFYDIVTHDANDANYIVGRFQKVGGYGTYRPSLTKINPDGSLAWSKTYLYNDAPSGGRYYGFSIDQDGDSLVMGLFCKDGGVSAPFETGIIKTDLDGNIGWARLYESPGTDLRTYNMESTPDGYLLAGWIETGDESLYMIKTDKSGNVVWAKSYGGSDDEDTYLMSSNSRVIVDDGYAVTVGRTTSFGTSEDIFLVKADLDNGELDEGSCYDDLTIIETTLPAFQADYFLSTERLPILASDPVVPVSDLDFDGSGELLDEIADTIVGGDTIHLCLGESITLFADWSTALDYLWSTGGTEQFETVSNTGTYWVEVSGGDCIIWSDTAHVLVDSLVIDLGPDTSLCNTDGYLLDAGLIADATYMWNDGSTEQTLLASEDGWYWVTVETANCSVTDSIALTFINLELELGPDTTICLGESLLIDATNPGAIYEWSDGSTDQTLEVTTTGEYWVNVSVDSCFVTDTIYIAVIDHSVDLGPDLILCNEETTLLDAGFIPGATYLWQDGTTDQTLLASDNGWYWVTVESDDCTVTDSIELTFESLELELGPDTTICLGESVLLDASNPGAIYEWSDGSTDQTLVATTSGEYWVNVSLGSCFVTDTISVTVIDITVDLGPDLMLCTGETALLDAGFIPGTTYLWNDGSTDQTLVVNTTGVYNVTVTNGSCTASDEITTTVFEPIADFSGIPLTGCAPLTVDFTDLSTTPVGIIDTWYWTFGDGGTSTSANPSHTFINPGNYAISLTVETDLGCTDDLLINDYIIVSQNVTANFTYLPNTVTANDVVTFTNLSTHDTSWLWDFGDGTTSTLEHPEHTFTRTGEYTITLTAMNDDGCNETVSYKLIVKDAVYIFVPNIFTPDGDDFNQIWKPSIYGIDIYDFHLILFNRWGEVIWESFDPSIGWNGSYGDGSLVQDGVYVWLMEYGDIWTDEKFKLEGHVSVIK